jgi:hypothetical protein
MFTGSGADAEQKLCSPLENSPQYGNFLNATANLKQASGESARRHDFGAAVLERHLRIFFTCRR